MVYCRICGAEEQVAYRERSRMMLCPWCHDATPEKATYREFLAQTFKTDSPTALIFFDDYKHSNFGSVAEYWESCND